MIDESGETKTPAPKTVSRKLFFTAAGLLVVNLAINASLVRLNHEAIRVAIAARSSGWCEGYHIASTMARIGARELRQKTGAALDSINPDNYSSDRDLAVAMLLRFVEQNVVPGSQITVRSAESGREFECRDGEVVKEESYDPEPIEEPKPEGPGV